MMRLGSTSLPLRLLRDAAPRQIPVLPITSRSNAVPRHFSTSEPLEIKRRGALIHLPPRLRKKKRYTDPQHKRVSEARVRKNTARQAVLQEQRILAVGDPVRGIPEPTTFVKSLDVAMDPEEEAAIIASGTGEPRVVDSDPQSIIAETTEMPPASHSEKRTPKPRYLRSFVTPSMLDESLEHSKRLVKHYHPQDRVVDRTEETRINKVQDQEHATAQEAMSRILAVEGANSKQRKHINIQRCIEEFGRHNTDKRLATQTASVAATEASTDDASRIGEVAAAPGQSIRDLERVGPDTGSSEVQIAILTAKIKRLADEQEGKAGQDKVNKRNLRLLVHRRQKLLKYFLKKSRGGPRWQHLIETLGLTPATWQGEISM